MHNVPVHVSVRVRVPVNEPADVPVQEIPHVGPCMYSGVRAMDTTTSVCTVEC